MALSSKGKGASTPGTRPSFPFLPSAQRSVPPHAAGPYEATVVAINTPFPLTVAKGSRSTSPLFFLSRTSQEGQKVKALPAARLKAALPSGTVLEEDSGPPGPFSLVHPGRQMTPRESDCIESRFAAGVRKKVQVCFFSCEPTSLRGGRSFPTPRATRRSTFLDALRTHAALSWSFESFHLLGNGGTPLEVVPRGVSPCARKGLSLPSFFFLKLTLLF